MRTRLTRSKNDDAHLARLTSRRRSCLARQTHAAVLTGGSHQTLWETLIRAGGQPTGAGCVPVGQAAHVAFPRSVHCCIKVKKLAFCVRETLSVRAPG
jgi:hypothetical protein